MVGFPPRLVVDPQHQELLRQEYRRVAARMGKRKRHYHSLHSLYEQNNKHMNYISLNGYIDTMMTHVFFHTTCLGVKFFTTAEHFPMSNLVLWSRDGVST